MDKIENVVWLVFHKKQTIAVKSKISSLWPKKLLTILYYQGRS